MSLPIPLGVRLRTSRMDRDVTAELRRLRFRSVVPGGFASAQIELDHPLSIQPDEIDYYARMWVYDARSGAVIWEGRLEDPGRTAGDGQVWQLTALGPSAHAKDRTVPLVYVDRRLNPYILVDNFTPGGTFTMGTAPDNAVSAAPQSLVFQFPQGLGVVNASRVTARYDLLHAIGQKLSRYDYTWDAGTTNASLLVQAVTRTDGGITGENSRSEAFSTTGAGSSPRVIVTNFPVGRNTLDLRIFNNGGASTVPADTFWAAISDLVVMATRYSKSGVELTSAASYTSNTLLASQVVEDVLGRLCPMFDGTNATIPATTHPIEQLAYEDGVDADGILSAMMAIEPAYYWAAWESSPANDLWRFEWAQWPTTVRYEATAVDGYDGPGSADGLFNAATVGWTEADGRSSYARTTTTVPALDDAGLVREEFLDAGNSTAADAAKLRDDFLTDHAAPPNAGRLTIARPILDRATGMMVDPWEIRPGALIRVRGILPRIDSLNPTDRDGVTIFRVASHEYDAGTAQAVCELDSYSLSTARALADLRPRRRSAWLPPLRRH